MWLLARLVKPAEAVRLLQELGVSERGGKGAAAFTIYEGRNLFLGFCFFLCYKNVNTIGTW